MDHGFCPVTSRPSTTGEQGSLQIGVDDQRIDAAEVWLHRFKVALLFAFTIVSVYAASYTPYLHRHGVNAGHANRIAKQNLPAVNFNIELFFQGFGDGCTPWNDDQRFFLGRKIIDIRWK